MILSNPKQEMSHVRVSPDRQWITFTRYNQFGLKGTASEDDGYNKTEILIARIDGSDVQTIVPPVDGAGNANSSWTPDGRGLVYCSNDNPSHLPQDMVIDLKTRMVSRLPTPTGLMVADPHWLGRRIVFTAIGKNRNVLWIMNDDGSGARELTEPPFSANPKNKQFGQGDYDPWLSPDTEKVAFMRMTANGTWHSMVIDVRTGKETDLTADLPEKGDNHDGVPEWSSDGKLLLLWHANLKYPKTIGIYSVRPDGSDRKMLPLPRGYQHTHPGFFPGDGSSPRARIIFGARRNPFLI
jgi:Tol biopolymer transport system component